MTTQETSTATGRVCDASVVLLLRICERVSRMVVDEMARVFSAEDEASMLLHRVAFPPSMVVPFSAPLQYWTEVFARARDGVLLGGVRPLIERAIELRPYNEVFRRYIHEDGTSSEVPWLDVAEQVAVPLYAVLDTIRKHPGLLEAMGIDRPADPRTIVAIESFGSFLAQESSGGSARHLAALIVSYSDVSTPLWPRAGSSQVRLRKSVLMALFIAELMQHEQLRRKMAATSWLRQSCALGEAMLAYAEWLLPILDEPIPRRRRDDVPACAHDLRLSPDAASSLRAQVNARVAAILGTGGEDPGE